MKRHSLTLLASEKWEHDPEDAYSRLDFASLRHISSSLGVARPFTNRLKRVRNNVQTLCMVGGARSISSLFLLTQQVFQ